MTEPWNKRSENSRDADTLITFIIFCEDQVSEPIYFQYFETERIKINPIGGQKSKTENIQRAVNICLEEGIMGYVGKAPKLLDTDPIVWCVFDRDKEDNPKDLTNGNTAFTHALEIAETRGIKVAWSNDSFELWILLHFEPINITSASSKLRNSYYERLSEIFMELPDPSDYLVKMRGYENFSYKRNLKSEKGFRNVVREAIRNKIGEAISRAKKLEGEYDNSTPDYEKAPLTMVHHLVEELINHGGKEI